MLEVILSFFKPDPNTGKSRLFKVGERFETVGEPYVVQEMCGTCRMAVPKNVTYQNILVDGFQMGVNTDFLGPVKATVDPVIVEGAVDNLVARGVYHGTESQADANFEKFQKASIFNFTKKQ